VGSEPKLVSKEKLRQQGDKGRENGTEEGCGFSRVKEVSRKDQGKGRMTTNDLVHCRQKGRVAGNCNIKVLKGEKAEVWVKKENLPKGKREREERRGDDEYLNQFFYQTGEILGGKGGEP